jgi:uncharacterized cupin superfamily protein
MPSIVALDAGLPLESAPINPSWITGGKPRARNRVLSRSTDGSSWTMLWDCTPGSFRWRYSFDETIHFLEGSVTITGNDGVARHFGPGGMVFFPAGSVADWRVHAHIKKLAFCHVPAPRALRVPLKAWRRLAAWVDAKRNRLNNRPLRLPGPTLKIAPDHRSHPDPAQKSLPAGQSQP